MKTSLSNIHRTKKKEAFRALQGNVVVFIHQMNKRVRVLGGIKHSLSDRAEGKLPGRMKSESQSRVRRKYEQYSIFHFFMKNIKKTS